MRNKGKRDIVSRIMGIFFPEHCVFCGDLLPDSLEYVCEKCAAKLSFSHINRILSDEKKNRQIPCHAPFVYEGMVKDSILAYKFRGNEESFRGLSAFLAKELWPFSKKWDVVTNVPVSHKRKKERGFDQSQRLAKHTARLLGLPYQQVLEKYRDTKPQHTLSKEERKINLKDAYRLRKGADVKGRRFLLIDDVVTTGSTLLECVSVLFEAGAVSVECGALASSERCMPDIEE